VPFYFVKAAFCQLTRQAIGVSPLHCGHPA
jgi:hypothetical protein